MSNRRRQRSLYAVAGLLAGLGALLIVAKCDDSSPVPTDQSTELPAKRERPGQKNPGPAPVEIAGASKTESVWRDPQSERTVRVKKTLVMTATPTFQEENTKATADILLDFREGANLWDEKKGDWRPMDEEEFGRWHEATTTYDRITFSATASVTKVIDSVTGDLSIESVSAFGTTRDDPKKDWSQAENGMSVFLDWSEDDLIVKWGTIGDTGMEWFEKTVEIPFSKRFETQEQ